MYNDRRDKIRTLLLSKPFVSLAELEAMFPNVSSMTLRRDIEYFEKEHEAIKVRGGARSTRFISGEGDATISARLKANVHSKDCIASRAAEFLETGRSIFLDSGSTLQRISQYIPNDRYIFTTTDPVLALDLCKIGLPLVNIVGGKLDKDNQTITGLQASRFLDDVNIDIAFLSPSGLSLRGGFSVGNYSECELKRIVVAKARMVIIMMDSSKIDKSMPYTFCDLTRADILITDAQLPDELAAYAREENVRVINVLDK
ncbi:MAG: DeoR/GlpR transcriptional regulator [Clostridia bacterium]|nr:DeoR/GlpR transcriptional regulator [Clostridia bacterium]